MVDLDTRKTIDMIPSREISQVATWLNGFPSLRLVSRDGSLTYKNAIDAVAGSPGQISDRFHMIKNCSEAISEQLKSTVTARIPVRYIETKGMARALLKERFLKARSDFESGKDKSKACKENRLDIRTFDKLSELTEAELENRFSNKVEKESQERFALKKNLILRAQEMFGDGLSLSEIDRRLGLDRRTAEKYVRKDAVGRYEKSRIRTRHNSLDGFSGDIASMLDSGATMANILRHLIAKGYEGSYSNLKSYISTRKKRSSMIVAAKTVGFQEVSSLLYHRRDEKDISRAEIVKLFDAYPAARELIGLMNEFKTILTKTKSEKALRHWILKARKFRGLNSFANGLERDWDAVINSLRYSYSNGLLESKVNKTKLFKRNMYGRCSFSTWRNKAIIYDQFFNN